MKEQSFIPFARILLRIASVFLSIFGIGLLVFMVFWHLDPDMFAKMDASAIGNAGFGLETIEGSNEIEPNVPLSKLPNAMMYWIVVRTLAFVVLVRAIIRSSLKILSNIATLKTFYDENIKSFEAMTRYGFIIALLSAFNFMYFDGHFTASFSFPFGPLIFALACGILAQVFSQGRTLSEEQKLIV